MQLPGNGGRPFLNGTIRTVLFFIDDGTLANGASRGDEKMIETCKQDGVFRTSKLLWTLGNYSFFIRPGMVRLSSVTSTDNTAEVMASAYADKFFKADCCGIGKFFKRG